METEKGPLRIRGYINHINQLGFYDGEIEINIVSDLYNLNISTYRQITDNNDNIRYYNSERNDENKNLMILSNTNNNHFTLLYHNNNNINIDLKYEIIENNEIINNHKLEDKAETIYSNENEYNDIDKQKFYRDLSSL